MKSLSKKNSSGFTLVEMITVIIILGVLAAAVTSFLKFGTQIYSETTARDQLVSSARFVIERLNRDIRNALPNSIRLTNSSACLEFSPILESTIYTDIPVLPEAATNEYSVIDFDVAFDPNWSVVVYPLHPDDVYINAGKVYEVASISPDADERNITLDSVAIHFKDDSPTQRLYFINGSVEYCLQNNIITRDGVLMAKDLDSASSSFEVFEATLQRNGMVKIYLQFDKNTEQISFNNEIQVLNVP